jgi:GNAT superfamily N-acetyltransferase
MSAILPIPVASQGGALLSEAWPLLPDGLVLRCITPAEAGGVHRLHCEIVAGLPSPDLFRPAGAAFFEAHCGFSGVTLGVFDGARLAAYSLMRFPGSDPDNLGRDIGLPEAELPHVVHFELVGVHPAYRGRSLQDVMLRARMPLVLAAGCHHGLLTVAPANLHSLRNTLRNGFALTALRRKYGGAWRYVLHRDLRLSPPTAWHALLDIPLTEVTAIGDALTEGWRGFELVVREDRPALRLGLPPA